MALICGAAGFIGSHAAAMFRLQGWRVVGAGRSSQGLTRNGPHDEVFSAGDFNDPVYVNTLMNDAKPSRVVFVAGPANVQQSFIDPVLDFHNQMLPLINVLDAARKLPKPPGVLLVSSAAVYGNPEAVPVAESMQLSPISPYGFHKLQQEMLLDEYSRIFGLPTCKARVFSTYGTGLRHLAVWDITQRALKAEYVLQGSGEESRDYLHVSDLARAFETICKSSAFEGEAINVASGVELEISKLAALIYRELGFSEIPNFAGSELSGSPRRWQADTRKLAALGFLPQMPIEQGISETVNWIRNNA